MQCNERENMTRILGLDPGLQNTGFGIIEIREPQLVYIASGVIVTTPADTLAIRLKTILLGIKSIIEQYRPKIASIEKVFVNVNPQSTLLLGQARGAAISACVLRDIMISEYTALQVKKSIVGYGHAQKQQVAKMVKILLNLNAEPEKDAADALAVALAHVHYNKICSIFNMSSVKKGRLIN